MENQIIKLKCFFIGLLCLKSLTLMSQSYVSSENLIISTTYNFDTICSYNESDSGIVIFQLGFEGKIAVLHNGKIINEINEKYSRNLEMIPVIIKFKRTNKDVIKVIYNDSEIVTFLLNNRFGISYINRLIQNGFNRPYWVLKFDNCFYPARR